MKACVIGAGFTGLATALRLQDAGFSVQIFDPLGIQGGASAAATGLVHPYVGESAYRSRYADDAMKASISLFQIAERACSEKVYNTLDLIRLAESEKTYVQMQKNAQDFDDVIDLGNRLFLVKGACVVYPEKYRQGLLMQFLEQKGELVERKITSLDELTSYELSVLCTGYGSSDFIEKDTYQYIKGQSLQVALKDPLQAAYVGKGYLCPTENENIACLGSTYEREFTSEKPDMTFAKNTLWKKGSTLHPCLQSAQVISCKAGVRVCSKGLYLPQVTKLAPKIYMITGMGSRGLLYHAYFAERFVWES